ncbi:hypothetical protein ACPESV_24695 [Streptomyces umbrinus]|uniref:hypothetical protein n=1 Tax=Streptomyces umbrinus TaxID=67370 RepID=UPI003C2E3199
MSARDELIEIVTSHPESSGGDAVWATDLVDSHRTEVLAKAVGRLRAIPVDCTALTGPVWYGDGWNSAITCLEEIADYQGPDDEDYPGELQRLRATVLALRVAALRKEDLARVQQVLADHEDWRKKATGPGAEPDFGVRDTNRRARLLHEMTLGARWKSGDVVRWYETQGLTGLGTRAARHDLAVLRDSGAITQHDEKGVRFYTRATHNTNTGNPA